MLKSKVLMMALAVCLTGVAWLHGQGTGERSLTTQDHIDIGHVYAQYNETIDIIGAGLAPGELDLTFELVNQGDPELHLDNLQVTNVPEPVTLGVLLMGILALLRRRK